MTTEVVMQRELLGDFVGQKSKSEFFSATDLFRVGNKWRVSNGLNPKLKLEVYEWIFDKLLMYRNDSGDSFKRMCGALFIRANKTDYVKNIQKLCKLIQGMWRK